MPNAVAIIGDYCPDRWRGTLIAAAFAGFSIGSILGGGLTVLLIAEHGWRAVYALAGALTLPVAPMLWRLLPDSPPMLLAPPRRAELVALLRRVNPAAPVAAEARPLLSGRGLAASPPRQLFQAGRAVTTLLLWLACCMSLTELFFLNHWLPTLLSSGGLGLRAAVLAATAFSLGGIVGSLSIGRLMDRFGYALVLAAAFICAAASVPLIGQAAAVLPAAVAAIFLGGFCVAGAQTGLNTLAVRLYPAPIRSTGVAWALGAGRTGAIFGPLLAGWMVGAGWSVGQVFLAAAVPPLGAAAAMLAVVARDARRAAPVSVIGAKPG
jgi:AAHS family 4-hydroxybenzoate transporter-like MFS transporter